MSRMPQVTAQELVQSYEILAAMPFFRGLEPRELLQVQALARPRLYADAEAIVAEGASGDSMYVLLAGASVVRKGVVDIARLGPGEFFGEMAMVERAPRSASVVADGGARVLEIARTDLFRLLRVEKDIGLKLLWNIISVLTGRLRKTSQQLGEAREELLAEDLTNELSLEEEASLPETRESDAPRTTDPGSTVPEIPDDAPTIPPPPPDPE